MICIKVESHSFVIVLLLPGRLCMGNVGRDLLATRALRYALKGSFVASVGFDD